MEFRYGNPMFFSHVDVVDEEGDLYESYSSASVQYGDRQTPTGTKPGFFVDDDFYPRSYNFKAE